MAKLRAISASGQPVEGCQDKALSAILAVALDLVAFEAAEGFRRIAFPVSIGGVEDVAQLVTAQAVFAGEEGIELGPQLHATIGVEGERSSSVAQVLGPWAHGMGCVGQF